MRRGSATVLALALVVGAGGASCRQGGSTLRVGTKSFTEQRILSAMLVRLLEDQGGRHAMRVECGDTYGCERQLRAGEIDLMVEYTGTGLAMLGVEGLGGEAALERVRALYRPLGLDWLGPLGFDNGYTVVVGSAAAKRQQLERIEDLQRLAGGVRIAVPPTYLQRPLDGLGALVRRYGLALDGAPVIEADPTARYRLVRMGEVDAAIGYATDGAIDDPRLVRLEDNLAFFPPYQAAIVVRHAALAGDPGLGALLAKLEAALDDGAMRSLNHAVALEGRTPMEVARRFLFRRGVGEAAPQAGGHEAALVVAVDAGAAMTALRPVALEAVRTVFAPHPVRLLETREPREEVMHGAARLALVGAETFFTADPTTQAPRRRGGLDAVAVVGHRMLQLVRRRVLPSEVHLAEERVGIVDAASESAACRLILASVGATVAMQGTPTALAAALGRDELDAVLLWGPVGDGRVARLLADDRLALTSLTSTVEARGRLALPYLRRRRIPAASYAGQREPVETLGSQVVLAAAAPDSKRPSAGSPAAALPLAGLPLEPTEAEALRAATGEYPDPLLPSPWSMSAPVPERTAKTMVLDTSLNVLAIAFVIWLLRLVLGR